VYFEQATEQVYKKIFLVTNSSGVKAPQLFITGESCLPDAFCPETISDFLKIFAEIFVFVIESLAKNTLDSR
jgi:hypothetical protein